MSSIVQFSGSSSEIDFAENQLLVGNIDEVGFQRMLTSLRLPGDRRSHFLLWLYDSHTRRKVPRLNSLFYSFYRRRLYEISYPKSLLGRSYPSFPDHFDSFAVQAIPDLR